MTRNKGISSTAWAAFYLVITGLVLCMPALRLIAQNTYGAVVGTVSDSSGAIIPGTKVTLTNLATNEVKKSETDAAGNYRFLTLPPANYRVEMEKVNYKKFVKTPVTVLVSMTAREDATLEVGAVNETVQVTAAAPLLQTDSGTLSTQVEGKTVTEMPLNGRNTMNLVALVPGVVPSSTALGSTTMNSQGHTSNGAWSSYQIGGTANSRASMMLDGASLNILGGNTIAYVPTQDSVQEFKVSTSAVDPAYGRFAGGVVEMSSKSGGNGYHASAYEYMRNTILNATKYFTTTKTKWIQNQYGVSGGGPVIKDKLFGYASWEVFNSRTANTTNTTVPTFAMRGGQSYNQNPVLPNITKDPTTDAAVMSRCPGLTYDASVKTMTIPSACIDSAANNIRKFWADPTNSNTPGVGNNYVASPTVGSDTNQYHARADYILSANQRIFAHYALMHMSDLPQDPMQKAHGYSTAGAFSNNNVHQATLGDTYTLNAKTILDVRGSYMRFYTDNQPTALGVDYSALGFSSNFVTQSKTFTTTVNPWPSVGGAYSIYDFMPMTVSSFDFRDNYALSASLMRIAGNHTVKIGGEVRFLDDVSTGGNVMNEAGKYTFSDNNFTKNGFANFLLGLPVSSVINTAQRTGAFNWYQGYYVSDTWNVNHKLTINYGIRWELPGAVAERKDNALVLLPDTEVMINSQVTRGTLALVNSDLYRHRTTSLAKRDLYSPRIGVAYRITDSTVLRGGFSVVYLPPDLSTTSAMPGSQLINLANYEVDNLDSGTAIQTPLNNPFDKIVQPTGRSGGATGFMSNYAWQASRQSITGPAVTDKYGYVQQWNIGLGHQFKGNFSVEAGYTGTVGVKLNGSQGLDQISSIYYSQIAALSAAGSSDAAIGNAMRANTRYPAYKNFTNTNAYYGHTSYNAVQMSVQKRFANSGTISSNYTWTKNIGDVSSGTAQDATNHRGDRALLTFDTAHRWVTSYVINLPFGKGQRFGSSLNGVLEHMIGGWALNGITTLQSGNPVALTDSQGNAMSLYLGASGLRPNYTAGCVKKTSGSAQARLSKWFDPSCFSHPVKTSATNLFGTESASDGGIKSHGVANWDISVMKSTRVTEKTNLQFRVEFFNVFNRVQFAAPNASLGGSSGQGGPGGGGGSFGAVTTVSNNPRQIQGSMRFSF